jgi:hypothetical protein
LIQGCSPFWEKSKKPWIPTIFSIVENSDFKKMLTINKISRLIKKGCNPAMLIGNYLDEFKNESDLERISSFSDEPVNCIREKAAYLAALVEQLCLAHNLEIPSWVNKKKYFLKYPLFYSKFQNLKATLIQESPVAFRRRNIFVSKNVLSRV